MFRTPAAPTPATSVGAAPLPPQENLDEAYADVEDQDTLSLMVEMREITEDVDLDDDARVGKNVFDGTVGTDGKLKRLR